MMMRTLLFFILIGLIPLSSYSQTASVYGNIRDEANVPLKSVSIKVSPGDKVFLSDEKGDYEADIPTDEDVKLTFTFVGYENFDKTVNLKAGQRFPLYVVMISKPVVIGDVAVIAGHDERHAHGTQRLFYGFSGTTPGGCQRPATN